MNTQTHRLIFNKSRGCMMAVAETASCSSKSPSDTSSTCRRPSKCTKTSKNGQFHLSNQPLAQWIWAQAAPDLIVFCNAQKTESGFLSGGGNVNITAGQAFRQVGSDIIAPGGDINILAKKVDIVEARETSQTSTEQKFKQSGLTLAITSPVISAIQQAQSMAQAAGNTSDGRMKALAGAATAFNLYNNAGAISEALTNPTTSNPQSAARITLSFGTSKSQSNSSSQSDSARGSTLAAGNNINITATGAGADSNLLVQGSSIKAGNSASLTADNQVNLAAAKNTSSQASTNSSSSSSLSVSWGAGGWGFGASLSKGKGSSDGADTTFTNSQVQAGNTAILQSGGDTNVKGAVVSANQIKADIGGNLNIESLQDTSTYISSQQSMSASASVGGGGNGASFSASKSNINSSFQSVGQQSGLKAGDGGFQVAVNNNTDLKGAVIASTQDAIDNNKNSFTTGGSLTITDIQNQASFKGTAVGASVGVGAQPTGGMGLSGVGVGIGSTGGNAASISSAGISGIAGNTSVRTGDAETGLQRIFNADKVQKEINAQVAITQAFTREAPKAVATYAQTKYDELKTTNPEEAKKWAEGGIYRVALHTLTGALGGGISGAAGAAASASAAPLLNDLQAGIASALQTAGVSTDVAKGIASGIAGLTAAGVGAAVGGAQGAATALTVDFNNRQLHPTEIQWIKANANRYALQKGISPADAEKQLAEQAFRQVQFGVEGQTDTTAQAFLKTAGNQLLPGDPNIAGQNVGYLFYATPAQRANANMYLASSATQADFYKQNGLVQPTAHALTLAAQKDAELRANLSTATKTAMGVAATVALGGLTPTMLQWALANPIAATQAGIISAETAAAIVSGAVTPTGLLQQMNNPQNARIIYNRLAAAATQNADSSEVVLGRYLAGNASSYEQVAQARGATYYQVKAWDDIAQELGSREKMWEINKAFLDKGIADGKRFVFTSDPEKILFEAPRSYSAEEVKYLKTLFNFEKKEGLWYGVKK